MSTAKFNTWQNPDGTENYKCRAWVNFNGTGTVAIRAAGNVTSITDNGTGLYTLNFTTALPDANYAVTTGVDSYSGSAVSTRAAQGVVLSSFSTTSVQVFTGATSAISLDDNPLVCVAIFR
jgi:hypothetical protein